VGQDAGLQEDVLNQPLDEVDDGLRPLARRGSLRQPGEPHGEISVLCQEKPHEAIGRGTFRNQGPEDVLFGVPHMPLPEAPKVGEAVIQSVQRNACLGPGQGLNKILGVFL
jgi:hypothetical protein